MEKKKKHILLLSSWYPSRNKPFLGNFIARLANLIATKHQVTVLYTTSDYDVKEIEVTDCKTGNLREIIIYYPKGKNILHKYFLQRIAIKKGLQLIKNVDLIHANVMLPKGMQFVIAKNYFKCPLFVLEHGSYFREEIRESRNVFEKLVIYNLKKKTDKLCAVSKLLVEDLQADFGQFEIETLPYHVDLKKFKPNSNKINNEIVQFLHVSTLDETVKDPRGIIEACKLLVQNDITNFHLTIISDESYEKWKKVTYSKKLEDFITFDGPKQEEELPPIYQKSDVFILFSKYETFSIVLAEAWACGIPVISTPVGIAKDLSSNLGIQVEIGNSESLAKAMHKVITKKVSFNSEDIRKYGNEFSAEKTLKKYNKLIEPLLKNNHRTVVNNAKKRSLPAS